MWSLRITRPFGKPPIRNVILFVAAVVAASFALSLLPSHATHAADAKWDSGTIVYGGKKYGKVLSESDTDRYGLPDGTVYMYKDEVNGDRPNAGPQKAYVIYFAPGSDPGAATKAHYATYDFTPPETYKKTGNPKEITTEKQSEEDKNAEDSCVVPGIGWIVCPTSNFLAGAMDWMYQHLAEFLEVRPLSSNQNNSLYEAWSIMRNIANVAFVIAFLIIIYSQVTTLGMSSYGIKKLLPRLVVAAVLVNVSYWICAAAIDISNIAGYSLNDLFMYLTEQAQKAGSDTRGFDTNFTNITQLVLSGGTLGAAGALAFLSVGSISGAIYMLLPILVGVLVAALVALIIMAARQAIIVILVIIAPLAFVAYLLPNTEKYFEKWKDIFLTMLMLFPIFGVLFGGSQLAGTAIIQNASSIIMLILGMAVQIAPLVLLPFLIKFGGSLLSRVAGMSNDRTKGLLDQTRQFAQNQSALKKSEVLARQNPRRRQLLTRAVQGWDNLDRKRQERQKVNETMADARWNGTDTAHRLHAAAERANLMKNIAEHDAEAHVVGLKRTNKEMQGLDLRARASKLHVDLTQAQVDANWEDFQAGKTSGLVQSNQLALSALARQVQQQSVQNAAVQLRQDAAKRQQTTDVSDTLLQNTAQIDGKSILEYSGGIQGSAGQEAALSKAVTSHRKQLHEAIENNHQLMNHFNISMEDKKKLALGGEITGTRPDGTSFKFKPDVIPAREAAISEILKKGSYGDIDEIILQSGSGTTKDYADTISRLIKEAGVDKKALYWGSKIIGEIEQGNISGVEGRNSAIIHHIEGGKITTDNLAGMDAKALQYMLNIAQQSDTYAAGSSKPEAFRRNSQRLHDTVKEIMDNDLLRNKSSEQARQNMERFLNGEIIPD